MAVVRVRLRLRVEAEVQRAPAIQDGLRGGSAQERKDDLRRRSRSLRSHRRKGTGGRGLRTGDETRPS